MRLKWGVDQLYFYLVCFVMLITMIIGITGLVRAGINIILPLPDAPPSKYVRELEPPSSDANKSQFSADVIESEINKQKEFSKISEQKNHSNQITLQLLRGLAQLIIAFPVYIYHWRKIPLLEAP